MGKKFTDEKRRQAVRMMAELVYTLKQAAEKIGCSPETARKWKNAYVAGLSDEEARTFEEAEDENRHLRKENTQLQVEVEILKKA